VAPYPKLNHHTCVRYVLRVGRTRRGSCPRCDLKERSYTPISLLCMRTSFGTFILFPEHRWRPFNSVETGAREVECARSRTSDLDKMPKLSDCTYDILYGQNLQ
jgi:hypothetical protein